MPPEESLSPQAVEDLTRWIERGALWPESHISPINSDKRHWAFQPLESVPVPEDPTGWSSQAIDRFISRAQQEEYGVRPMQPADKSTLLRRVRHEGWRYPETVRWAARGAQIVFHPHTELIEDERFQPIGFADPRNSFHEKAALCRAAENSCYFATVNNAFPGECGCGTCLASAK